MKINENFTVVYITGIGISHMSNTYIRGWKGNPCHLDLEEKPQKCTKYHKKIMHFSNTFLPWPVLTLWLSELFPIPVKYYLWSRSLVTIKNQKVPPWEMGSSRGGG